MSFIDSIPQSQTALAAGIFFATFVYEDGATLLAATLSASGRLDPRLGLLSAFLGIWVGDIGLYGLGSSVGRHVTQWQWLQRVLKPTSLARAEGWFAKHGAFALVISRAIPGSRLPLYVGAGALRLPLRVFARVTAACAAVWVSVIFAIWRFAPPASSGWGRVIPWALTALLLVVPWGMSRACRIFLKPIGTRAAGVCAL